MQCFSKNREYCFCEYRAGRKRFRRRRLADPEELFDPGRQRLREVLFAMRQRTTLVRRPAQRRDGAQQNEGVTNPRPSAERPRQRRAHRDRNSTPQVICHQFALVTIGASERGSGEHGRDCANHGQRKDKPRRFTQRRSMPSCNLQYRHQQEQTEWKMDQQRMKPAQ
jgi:hypothetical protein